MSVVACKILDNGYEIASDSITIRGYTQTRGQTTDHSKLFEVNDLVVGVVGSAQEGALFRLFAATRQPLNPTAHAILEFLSEFSDWKNKKIGDSSVDNSYIVGFKGKVFAIEQWLVEEILTYEAIGAGMDFALAALYLGKSAEEAVKTAIELSVFCESPVKVIVKTQA